MRIFRLVLLREQDFVGCLDLHTLSPVARVPGVVFRNDRLGGAPLVTEESCGGGLDEAPAVCYNWR